MKIIDLLNKIANGEDVPKKIQVYQDIFVLDNSNKLYEHETTRTNLLNIYNGNILNYEVEEVKEMCHKCGKYPAEYNLTECEFCLGISEEDKKIEKISINDNGTIGFPNGQWTARNMDKAFAIKINKIIDKLDSMEE